MWRRHTLGESRSLKKVYSSHLGRWAGELGAYANLPPDKRNVFDGTMHAIAGVVHGVTGALDALFRDGARLLHGSSESLAPLGNETRMGRDLREGWQNLTRGRIFGALSSWLSVPGDLIPDGVDAVAGVRRSNGHSSLSKTHPAPRVEQPRWNPLDTGRRIML